MWNRRSVSRFFMDSRCGRHDKGDRLGLPPNQSWHFSFYSGFSHHFFCLIFALYIHPSPTYPLLCSPAQSLSSFYWLSVTFVREIFLLMAALHFYPSIPNLFAMCDHNQSISFERSPETYSIRGNFPPLHLSPDLRGRVRGGWGASFFSSLTQLNHETLFKNNNNNKNKCFDQQVTNMKEGLFWGVNGFRNNKQPLTNYPNVQTLKMEDIHKIILLEFRIFKST